MAEEAVVLFRAGVIVVGVVDLSGGAPAVVGAVEVVVGLVAVVALADLVVEVEVVEERVEVGKNFYSENKKAHNSIVG